MNNYTKKSIRNIKNYLKTKNYALLNSRWSRVIMESLVQKIYNNRISKATRFPQLCCTPLNIPISMLYVYFTFFSYFFVYQPTSWIGIFFQIILFFFLALVCRVIWAMWGHWGYISRRFRLARGLCFFVTISPLIHLSLMTFGYSLPIGYRPEYLLFEQRFSVEILLCTQLWTQISANLFEQIANFSQGSEMSFESHPQSAQVSGFDRFQNFKNQLGALWKSFFLEPENIAYNDEVRAYNQMIDQRSEGMRAVTKNTEEKNKTWSARNLLIQRATMDLVVMPKIPPEVRDMGSYMAYDNRPWDWQIQEMWKRMNAEVDILCQNILKLNRNLSNYGIAGRIAPLNYNSIPTPYHIYLIKKLTLEEQALQELQRILVSEPLSPLAEPSIPSSQPLAKKSLIHESTRKTWTEWFFRQESPNAVFNAEIMAKNSQVDSKNSAVLHHYGKVLRCTTDITTWSVHIVVNYSEKSAQFFENWARENESPGRRSWRNALRARAILDSLENDISKMRQAEMNRIYQLMREWGEEEAQIRAQKECQKMAKIHWAAYQIKYSKYPNQHPSLVYKPLSRKSWFLS